MVNQAFRIKIAYRSEKKKEEEENTRDRSVPDGSDNDLKRADTSSEVNAFLKSYSMLPSCKVWNVVASAKPCGLVEPEITNSLLAAN